MNELQKNVKTEIYIICIENQTISFTILPINVRFIRGYMELLHLSP